MPIEKLSNQYVNNNAAWSPLRNTAKKLNELVDAVNGITDGAGTETFENVIVTDTLTTNILTSTESYPDYLEAGEFSMNKVGALQATNITTTVIAQNQAFNITTVSSTLATNTSATFTVTNDAVTANSIILLSAYTGGTGIPIATVASRTAGSFNIKLYNAGTADLNNTVKIDGWIII